MSEIPHPNEENSEEFEHHQQTWEQELSETPTYEKQDESQVQPRALGWMDAFINSLQAEEEARKWRLVMQKPRRKEREELHAEIDRIVEAKGQAQLIRAEVEHGSYQGLISLLNEDLAKTQKTKDALEQTDTAIDNTPLDEMERDAMELRDLLIGLVGEQE